MRQARRTGRTPSTGATGRRPQPPADNPRAALIQRWDELLRLAPADMGLTAALGDSGDRGGSDPIAWLSVAADIPRAALDHVRQVRNNVASNRPVPDRELASALETVDRALSVVGRSRFLE